MKNLRVYHLVKDNDRYWIRTKRQKSGVASNIPLLPIPLALIRKHHPDFTAADPTKSVMPVTSNQKTIDFAPSPAIPIHACIHSF